MNFLYPTNVWQADNLPDGLSLNNGIISGIPTVKGSFDVPVTVSNELGRSTKNIRIITKYRPGTEKYSILQDGVEIEKVTISQLQTMVQNGTAQERFNCTNTQIILPIYTPEIQYLYFTRPLTWEEYQVCKFVPNYAKRASSFEYVAVNFCSFRNVTLLDGTQKPGLILQFDKPLWSFFAPFDTGDSPSAEMFNRWKYSTLRQWLNASGLHWFSPAYDGDTLLDNSVRFPLPSQEELDYWGKNRWQLFLPSLCSSSYADANVPGFLDFLPEELSAILQPVKIVTQAFFDDDNDNPSIDDPDFIDGFDADVTYDKVFIPSLDEMFIRTNYDSNNTIVNQYIPHGHIEGTAWEFYAHRFFSNTTSHGSVDNLSDLPTEIYINGDNLGCMVAIRNDFNGWGHSLAYDFDDLPAYSYSDKEYYEELKEDYETNKEYYEEIGEHWDEEQYKYLLYHCFQKLDNYPVLTRSASMNGTSGVWCLTSQPSGGSRFLAAHISDSASLDSTSLTGTANSITKTAGPAPAFVIC